MTTSITVIIADDHAVTRLGLRSLLQAAPDIELVGEAADGDAAQQLIAQLKPRVAVLDLVMPGAAPADIDKNERGEALLAAIRKAACGQILFTQGQRRRAKDWRENVQVVWETLTPREREVLRLLKEGLSNREIAEHLHIVEKTVEKHIGEILGKLGVASRTEAVLWVLNAGLDKACDMVGKTPDKE